MKTIFTTITLFLFALGFSQQEGYWDKDRATTKEIDLTAGSRIAIKSEDLPLGTTEIVYRITLLDNNQQMANSLVSLLKAIPDPSGISQGSAGAVFLLSKVSGDDKCKYAIFSSEKTAMEYENYGKSTNACFVQNKSLSKDAKRLTAEKSTCFTSESENIWFGFESQNWIMKQKIILEIVPWVDTKLSRGWNVNNRKELLKKLESATIAKKLINKNELSLCVLEKIQQKYRYKEFQNLLEIERAKFVEDAAENCFAKPSKALLSSVRADSYLHFKNKKYAEAIELLKNFVVEKNNANVSDYNYLGYYYLFSKQYEKSFQALTTAEKMDPAEIGVQLNLAHYYLLNDDFKSARDLHKKYKDQNISATQSWSSKAKSDFAEMEKAGLKVENVSKILKVLEE